MFDHFAREDFERARRKAFWNKILALLLGKQNELLPFDEIQRRLPMKGQRYLGLQQVPLDKIVGSMSRYRDFDRAFLPTQEKTRDRWINIDKAHYQDVALPPVELYKIGDIYFVKDGNHRISVARERGQMYIDAFVTEIDVPVPLTPDMDVQEVVRKAEYAAFLEQTHLDTVCPDANFELTLPGQYDKLLEHIEGHRWFLAQERGEDVSFEEAVKSWCENVYRPVVKIIEEQNILDAFPGRTPTDLYLWIIEHHWYLREAYGDVPLEEAARHFAEDYAERPIKRMTSIIRRATRELTGKSLKEEKNK